eukprot:m.14017 g.14017  ORF g.14017 m.14017 type:complete len:506 (-) comp4966_c0_seq1:306-1823(-)
MANFKEEIKKCMEAGKRVELPGDWQLPADATEAHKRQLTDKRLRVELGMREILMDLLVTQTFEKRVFNVLDVAIQGAQDEICLVTTPLALMEDLCDCSVLSDCQHVFAYLESKVDVWNKAPFVNSMNFKNTMLRLCNSIKRRLSKSQNTVFCGRILMFLASVTPLADKSGVNLRSTSSINTTEYDQNAGQDEDKPAAEVDEQKDRPAAVDYNLYKHFWKLQRYFQQPSLCLRPTEWTDFTKCTNIYLDAAASLKLESVRKAKGHDMNESAEVHEEYFPKYLTSVKLFNLQQADSAFRRQIFVQFLILFQSLMEPNKFQKESLLASRKDWIVKMQTKILSLLKKTPPRGTDFLSSIELITQNEKHWIEWKNQGCQDFGRAPSVLAKSSKRVREENGEAGPAAKKLALKLDLGTPELTRLWNLTKCNLDGCKSDPSELQPSIKDFLAEAKAQMDPEECVEEEYWKIKDPSFRWRAVRLLAKNHLHLFQEYKVAQGLEEYLKAVMAKI